jgi:nitroreductase
MDLYEAIRRRCSVRSYQPKDVEDDALRRVLDAGRLSPSARNRQERKFVVVRDADRRKALAAAAEQPWLAEAPVVIAVVGTTPDAVMYCDVPTDPVDCAIAIDHMTLAAAAEGLGTCWLGHFKQDECRQVLGVPDGAKIVELLALGWPVEAPVERPRKGFDEVVCWDRYE